MNILNNLKILKDEVQLNNRKMLCHNCEYLKVEVCIKCGCIMPLKWKLELASCPVGKW